MIFQVGDIVYHAKVGNKQIQIPCPVCFGKMAVTVILGNGDKLSTVCNFCGIGYSAPRGFVDDYNYVAEAVPYTITGVEIQQSQIAEDRIYFSDHCRLREADCYATEKEALAAAQSIKEQREREQATRSEYIKADKVKSFSWNAGYHLRQVKDMERRIEYHKKMAVLCKERSKDKESA